MLTQTKNNQKKGPKRTIVRERVVERNRHVRPQFLVCTVYDGARLMRGNLLLVECVDGSINSLSGFPHQRLRQLLLFVFLFGTGARVRLAYIVLLQWASVHKGVHNQLLTQDSWMTPCVAQTMKKIACMSNPMYVRSRCAVAGCIGSLYQLRRCGAHRPSGIHTCMWQSML